MYYRRLAMRSPWSFIQLAVFPLAAAGFLAYIILRSVAGLGGWTGRDLVSLYVMLGVGVVIMLYVRFTGTSDYFSLPRETYEPDAAPQPAKPQPLLQPRNTSAASGVTPRPGPGLAPPSATRGR